jgi:hypothetical protein
MISKGPDAELAEGKHFDTVDILDPGQVSPSDRSSLRVMAVSALPHSAEGW